MYMCMPYMDHALYSVITVTVTSQSWADKINLLKFLQHREPITYKKTYNLQLDCCATYKGVHIHTHTHAHTHEDIPGSPDGGF